MFVVWLQTNENFIVDQLWSLLLSLLLFCSLSLSLFLTGRPVFALLEAQVTPDSS